MSAFRILQIAHDAASLAKCDPAFEVLDNTSNERPDWYEYWQIRRFLSSGELNDSCLYGFFSPKFRDKTGLEGAEVCKFLHSCCDAEVVTFSPFPDEAALFLSVFEHGETAHPGLLDAFRQFLPRIGYAANALDPLVTDARTSVFCNFFVARPRFWRAWQHILDVCVQLAEDAASPMHATLNSGARYRAGSAPMKVFIMERVCSFLLSTSHNFVLRNYPPFALPLNMPWATPLLPHLVVMDATKIAYRTTRDAIYLQSFRDLQSNATRALAELRARDPNARARA